MASGLAHLLNALATSVNGFRDNASRITVSVKAFRKKMFFFLLTLVIQLGWNFQKEDAKMRQGGKLRSFLGQRSRDEIIYSAIIQHQTCPVFKYECMCVSRD